MEKALDVPNNVMIYKQYWDHYSKTPGLLEKLKGDNPVQHHLLQHFRQNFWHLVENMEKVKKEAVEQQQAVSVGQDQDHLRPVSGEDNFVIFRHILFYVNCQK